MFVKKCDRCGKYYDKNNSDKTGIAWIDNHIPWDLREHSIDLCDECITELEEWLKFSDNAQR